MPGYDFGGDTDMKKRITQALVDDIKPDPKRDLYVTDDGLTGFRLKVTPAGKRILFFQYRADDGRQRKITFGSSDKLTVAEARKLATDASNRVRGGADPQAESDRRKVMSSLGDALAIYVEAHVRPNLKPSTAHEYERSIKALPEKFTSKKLDDVTRADIAGLMRDMRSAPHAANGTHSILHAFFEWALGDGGLMPSEAINPARGVRRYPAVKRSFVFEGDQAFRFNEALNKLESVVWRPAILAARLLLLTGMRREEVLQLTWAEVDIDGRRINLKDSKSGARVVPIGKDALAVLETAKVFREAFGGQHVFPSSRDRSKPIVGFNKTWERIKAEAGMPKLRIHDLRHNFGGMAAASTRSAVHVKGLLGHTQISTTDRYMKLGDNPLSDAADATNDAITAAMQPKNVVSLKGRG